jgi:hypothetical protein
MRQPTNYTNRLHVLHQNHMFSLCFIMLWTMCVIPVHIKQYNTIQYSNTVHTQKYQPIDMLYIAFKCLVLAGNTGFPGRTRFRTHRFRASQRWWMDDMSVGMQARTGTFSASRNCVQILATWGHALSCWNTRWWRLLNSTTMDLRISSWYLCGLKLSQIICNCVGCPLLMPALTITPTQLWCTLFTTLTLANPSPTWCHTRCLPSARYIWNQESFVNRTLPQCASGHRRWAFAHWSQLRHRTAIRSRRWWW